MNGSPQARRSRPAIDESPRRAPLAATSAPLHPTGLLITGTDTGVGKTILSAALLAAIVAADMPVRAYKPAVTGLAEPAEPAHDHELLASLSGQTPEEVSPLRYQPAVSPQLAAELAGEPVAGADVLATARAVATEAATASAALIVEGVGGLLVPLADDLDVRRLAAALALPLLIAARPGLGTINHTLLTVQATREAGLDVRAVVITPWPERAGALERSNRETIARRGEVEVATLARLSSLSRQCLAAAGATLPWRRWLA